MRKRIVAGNWKMNLDLPAARDLCTAIAGMKIKGNLEVVLGSPSPYLYHMATLTEKNKKVHIAAQNCHYEDKGAYTGEVSHSMLTSIGVNQVIIGHSERRELFKESNSLLKEKVNKLVSKGFSVIFCCGEPLKIRKAKKQESYVLKQLKASLFQLSAKDMKRVVIAYEPIWAIGTGVTASPSQAQQMHKYIRTAVAKKYSKKTAKDLTILYGGSVKPANAKELFSKPDVDGGLVGGASLKADSFKKIVAAFG